MMVRDNGDATGVVGNWRWAAEYSGKLGTCYIKIVEITAFTPLHININPTRAVGWAIFQATLLIKWHNNMVQYGTVAWTELIYLSHAFYLQYILSHDKVGQNQHLRYIYSKVFVLLLYIKLRRTNVAIVRPLGTSQKKGNLTTKDTLQNISWHSFSAEGIINK